MKTKIITLFLVALLITFVRFADTEKFYHPEFSHKKNRDGMVFAYPPGVGILTKSKNCIACHVNNGPWADESKTIIDILDGTTKKSLKQTDGSFIIEAKRHEPRLVYTVLGRSGDDDKEAPYRNAWTYIDPKTIEANTLSKFAPGWECNLQLSCRVVGDKFEGFEGAKISVLPMTVRPTDAARDGELQLQVMLTKGESVKGVAAQGMMGNYFEKKVLLKVTE